MVNSLHIRRDGSIENIFIENIEGLVFYCSTLYSSHKVVEIHELEDDSYYEIIARREGEDFSFFDLKTINAVGSIFVVKYNQYGNLIDCNETEFLNYYLDYEDLDDTLLEDETEVPEIQEEDYEINDFVVDE